MCRPPGKVSRCQRLLVSIRAPRKPANPAGGTISADIRPSGASRNPDRAGGSSGRRGGSERAGSGDRSRVARPAGQSRTIPPETPSGGGGGPMGRGQGAAQELGKIGPGDHGVPGRASGARRPQFGRFGDYQGTLDIIPVAAIINVQMSGPRCQTVASTSSVAVMRLMVAQLHE